jgi:hypothetical protein
MLLLPGTAKYHGIDCCVVHVESELFSLVTDPSVTTLGIDHDLPDNMLEIFDMFNPISFTPRESSVRGDTVCPTAVKSAVCPALVDCDRQTRRRPIYGSSCLRAVWMLETKSATMDSIRFFLGAISDNTLDRIDKRLVNAALVRRNRVAPSKIPISEMHCPSQRPFDPPLVEAALLRFTVRLNTITTE